LSAIYAASGDLSKLPFFEKQMKEVDGYGAINLMDAYRSLLAQGDAAQVQAGIAKMKALALDQTNSPWRRLAATKALNDWREEYKATGTAADKVDMLGKLINEVKAAETEPQLQQIYVNFGS